MEVCMKVTVSPKYQVVIPLEIRKALNIQPGEKMEIIPYENRIEFVPLKNIKDMRGFLKGIDTIIERDGDRF
ncbi:MAG TPA: AbrB/MazE/SpoVT family DNA-binding domain-containing protein [bacterium]|nr:AbrB/MazE/SpoVT family DNA-binding domain-containing protein [bacterium]